MRGRGEQRRKDYQREHRGRGSGGRRQGTDGPSRASRKRAIREDRDQAHAQEAEQKIENERRKQPQTICWPRCTGPRQLRLTVRHCHRGKPGPVVMVALGSTAGSCGYFDTATDPPNVAEAPKEPIAFSDRHAHSARRVRTASLYLNPPRPSGNADGIGAAAETARSSSNALGAFTHYRTLGNRHWRSGAQRKRQRPLNFQRRVDRRPYLIDHEGDRNHDKSRGDRQPVRMNHPCAPPLG